MRWRDLAGWAERAGLVPDLRDFFVFAGLGCLVYGVSLINVPAAWVVGGAALFWIGLRRVD